MKKITSRLFSQSPTRHRLPRSSTGTFQCRTTAEFEPRALHASRPPSRAALPPGSTSRHFFFIGESTSRLLCAKPTTPTQFGETEHDGPHVPYQSHVVITTDTHPINSRARGVGWLACLGFACYGPALGDGKCQKAPGSRARAIATTGALCSSSHGGSGAYLVVPGRGCEVEIRNAPNGTAALIFVWNAEAARCVSQKFSVRDVQELLPKFWRFATTAWGFARAAAATRSALCAVLVVLRYGLF